MVIRWDSESDWQNEQDSSGTVGRNGELKQGYSRQRPDLSTDLVGYWPLHDKNATDYSGNNNHGTLNGGVTTGVAGKAGLQAMSFDGNDDVVDIPYSYCSDFGSSSFSIAGWIKVNSDGRIVDNRNESSGFVGTYFNISGGNLEFGIDDGSTSEIVVEGSIDVNDGEWHHVVAMRDNSSNGLRLFVDGEEDSNTTYTDTSGGSIDTYGSISHSQNTQIGAEYVVSDGTYAGHIKSVINNVRIYNRGLSSSEIKKLYRGGSGDFARPPTDSDGGVAYYPLDGNADDQWSTNNGTVNGATFTDNSVRGKAVNFDSGNNEYINLPFSSPSDSFTISTWVNPDSLSNYNRIISAENGAVELYTESDGDIKFRWSNGSSTYYGLGEGDYSNGTGSWSHICMAYDYSSSETRAYINSSLVRTVSSSGSMTSSSAIEFGRSYNSSNYYDGQMDDVRIYSQALTPQQIFQLYRWGTRGRDIRKQLVNH